LLAEPRQSRAVEIHLKLFGRFDEPSSRLSVVHFLLERGLG